ncbi:hypothetical protein M3204_01610 [Mesobacillus subterraneus]|uniref:hypothetical protein n=1 Tax=Mesobacillus subterraneus TaxID=285983 RepID=UPI00203A5110|nr:hypothetical protein [Mesobacillus subterraneus]MCM3663083.1 hypothetical protein [Mesobacillus subterraneus]MCM3682741.1 hypothetical protein [Mesobacillus subterraneus]
MGYILPVTNYQYIQYAEREIGTDYDPFQIGRISRIRKEDPVQKGREQELVAPAQKRQDQQPVARMQMAGTDFNYPKIDRVYKKRVNPLVVNQTYAELTGKGKHYSESI